MLSSLGITLFILVVALANLALGFALAWYLRHVRVDIAWPRAIARHEEFAARAALQKEMNELSTIVANSRQLASEPSAEASITPLGKADEVSSAASEPTVTPIEDTKDLVAPIEAKSPENSPVALSVDEISAEEAIERAVLESGIGSVLTAVTNDGETPVEASASTAPSSRELPAPPSMQASNDLAMPDELLSAIEQLRMEIRQHLPDIESAESTSIDAIDAAPLAPAPAKKNAARVDDLAATSHAEKLDDTSEVSTIESLESDLAEIAAMFGAELSIGDETVATNTDANDSNTEFGEAKSAVSPQDDWERALAENSAEMEAALASLRAESRSSSRPSSSRRLLEKSLQSY